MPATRQEDGTRWKSWKSLVLFRLKDANGLLHRAVLGCLRSQAVRGPGNSSPEIPGETAKKEAEGRQILAAMPGRVVTDPR